MPDVLAIAVRFGLYLDLMLVFGLPMFGLYSFRGAERRSGSVLPFRSILCAATLTAIMLSILGLMVLAASMSGVEIAAVDRTIIDMILSGTTIGKAWQIRMVALMLTLSFCIAGWRRPAFTLAGVSLSAAVALMTLAWTGHGAATEGKLGWLHLGSDISHLLAAGVWIGALFALIFLIFLPFRRMDEAHVQLSHRAFEGFSSIGTLAVGILIASGLVNAWTLVGPEHAGTLFTSLYGRLLLLKIGLFGVMLLLAGANRYFLNPAFARAVAAGNTRAAIQSLRRSLIAETSAALLILGLVAWLGLLAPPAVGT